MKYTIYYLLVSSNFQPYLEQIIKVYICGEKSSGYISVAQSIKIWCLWKASAKFVVNSEEETIVCETQIIRLCVYQTDTLSSFCAGS